MQLGKYYDVLPWKRTLMLCGHTMSRSLGCFFVAPTTVHFDEKITSTRLENMNGEYVFIWCKTPCPSFFAPLEFFLLSRAEVLEKNVWIFTGVKKISIILYIQFKSTARCQYFSLHDLFFWNVRRSINLLFIKIYIPRSTKYDRYTHTSPDNDNLYCIFFICIRKFKAFSNAYFLRKNCIFLRKIAYTYHLVNAVFVSRENSH